MHQKADSMPSSKKLRIIFAGTPEFARVILDSIAGTGHNIVGVYCQPDRPKGRGRNLAFCSVKDSAISHGLDIYQPESLNEDNVKKQIFNLNADVMIVVAYGQILPLEILNMPKYGCLNVHASLLPRWRGAAPIQRAILSGDKETGVGVMLMDKGLDTGDILLEKKCIISDTDNAKTLHDKLANLGSKAIIQTLININKIKPIPQDVKGVKYAKKLSKDEAWIDWNDSAKRINQQIKAFNPYPIAQTYASTDKFTNKVLRILSSSVIVRDDRNDNPPGDIINSENGACMVATGDGVLSIENVQLAGKNAISIKDFNNAYKLIKLS